MRKPKESIADYLIELKMLSQNCDFGSFREQALRDQLIFGVNQERIQSKLLSETTLTFDGTCQIAESMEMTISDLNNMRQNQSEIIAAVNARQRNVFSRLQPKEDPRGKSRYANYRCHNCSKLGHFFLARFCRVKANNNGKKEKVNAINERDEESEDIEQINREIENGPVFMEVNMKNKIIKMEIDTGASRYYARGRQKTGVFRFKNQSNF